ncbi:unnamed protein product [Choristocarpus tenellus]
MRRAETLVEERMYSLVVDGKAKGNVDKDRTADLVVAYRRLFNLRETFRELLDAVDEVRRRESECQRLEAATNEMLSEAGTSLSEVN